MATRLPLNVRQLNERGTVGLMKAPVSHLRAICFAIAGFTFWVLCDSAVKLAGQSQLPSYEIIAFLGIFIATFVFAYALWRGEVRELWPKRPKRMLFRASLDVGNNLCVVVALRHLSLTLFYILVFMSPMVVVILSRIFLHERLDWRKAIAILAGFLGVVIAVDPFRASGNSDWIGYAACAVCVSCFSTAIVWSRVISQTERPESVTFFSGLVTASVGLAGMLVYAAPLNGRLMAVLPVMGMLCALGNLCVFIAVKHTTAATVSQYHYTQLISGAAVAYLFFREKPTRSMLVGAVLIVASGLYIVMRATRADYAKAMAR
jgi:drug/metabolite transporter (DMT)-like permease